MQVGVLRAVLDFTTDDEVDAEPEHSGRLFIQPDDGELIEGEVVLYTLDQRRLVGMLAAARDGEPVADILLALEAAALDEPDDDEADPDGLA